MWTFFPNLFKLRKPTGKMRRRTLLDAFSEDFSREIQQARNYPEAYERATQKFESDHGFSAFDSYDSFRKKVERKRKKGR